MSHSLRGRLDRLERSNNLQSGGLHPRFYDAICGIFPIELLDPETRQRVESLYVADPEISDVIEEQISGTLADATTTKQDSA